MSSVTAEMAATYRSGRASWDVPGPAVNPWNGTGPTARERVLSVMWRRGRLSGVSPVFRGAAASGS